MTLRTRLFAASVLLVVVTVAGLLVSIERLLRTRLVADQAVALEREARLVAAALPADSAVWPDAARTLGILVGHRVTLIDSRGRVRGDTEFDRGALTHLENHAGRPEVRAALSGGVGSDERLSASTNERRLYVAVRGGPSGLAIVRLSATLAAVDAHVHAVQRAVAGAGLLAVVAGAALAWLLSRNLARPLLELGDAARAIAAGRPPRFPDGRIPEIADHATALRAMHGELESRFADLHRRQAETAALVAALSDGLIAADTRGNIVTCNPAARRLLRLDATSTVPPPLLDELFHDKAARDVVRELLAGRDVEGRELTLGSRTVLATGRALPDGGTLIVLRDLTDLRRLEAVRRDFVANVSHELKTPLTSIAGYAETLAAEAPAGSQTAQFAKTILANAQRMQHLVDDLLDLSRIESGSWSPVPIVVDLDAAARDAWSPFADRATASGVQFEIALPAEVAHAVADSEALRDIFTNLFDNALRHTQRGGRIRVEAEVTGDGLAVAVVDTGSGIPSDHLPRIFERFYRVDPARSRSQGGTGLGLAIVKHLIEAHGGRVTAESTVGRGTAIRFTLPPRPEPA
jgi:two-component system, OmpR family, phosphate regulon sensor histidine kinase PhoR